MMTMTTTTTTTDDDEKKRIILNDDDDNDDNKKEETEKEDHTNTTTKQSPFYFTGHPSRKRQPLSSFECSESIQDDDDFGTMIIFSCKLPNNKKKLIFNCRDSSNGVLIKNFTNEIKVIKNESHKGQVDHNFFDKGYTLAGSTGFQIWPGSRLMTEAICWPLLINSTTIDGNNDMSSSYQQDDCLKLQVIQKQLVNTKNNNAHAPPPLRILEIGAGIGVVGIALASLGGHVLQTDLHTLTNNAIKPNQILNKTKTTSTEESSSFCPEFLQPYADDVVTIDNGYAATTTLDWTKSLEEQIPIEVLKSIDIIIGCDCLWLKHMENDLLTKIQRIFELSPNSKLLITYQRRGNNTMFTTIESVLTTMKEKYHWEYDCLAWRSIDCSSDGDSPDEDGENDLFLIEIVPSSTTSS